MERLILTHPNHRLRSVLVTAAFAFISVILTSLFVVANAAAPDQAAVPPAKARVERGNYLVSSMGCHDCHTPWVMGDKGPHPDMTRALSGHPQSIVMPPPPALPPGPWIGVMSASNTA